MKLIRAITIYILFSTSTVFAQSWNWTSESESINSETFNSIAVDEISENVYAGGTIQDATAFTQVSTVFGDDDGVIIKYDLDGAIEWAFAIGGTGDDEVLGIVADTSTGNIFVTGYIDRSGLISFEGASPGVSSTVTLTGENLDVFTACYTSNGALLWFRTGGGADDDAGIDIALNANGVYVTGFFTDNATFGSQTSNISNASTNFFVVSYELSSGSEQWLNTMGSASDDFNLSGSSSDFKERKCGITADQNGVYCANYFAGLTYDIAHQSGNSSITDLTLSPEDIVAMSFDNSGALNWSALYDNRFGSCNGVSITNDCHGVYLTGTLSNLSTSPGGVALFTDGDNPFISRLDKTNGSEDWILFLNSHISEGDFFMDVAVDDFGYVYAAGIMGGTNVQISSFSETGGASYREPLIVKCRIDGTFESLERLPSTDDSWAISVDLFEEHQLFLAGEFNGSIDFGTFNTQPTQIDDAFLARLDFPRIFKYTSTVSLGSEFCSDEPDPTPTFESGTASGSFSGPTEIVFLDINTGEIDLSASTPGGPYTITFSNSTISCEPYDASFDITIFPADDPSFNYGSNAYCQNEANPTPTINTPGGTFVTTVGLILVSASTGQIDLAASTPGTYTLNYTTNGVNCPRSATFNVTISAQEDASFSYPATAICQGESNPIPNAVTTGGTYSGPAGIVFVSTATGEINLAASTSGGPYTITHTTNGTCPNSTTFDITINPEDDAIFSYLSNSYCQGESDPTPAAIINGGTYSGPAGIVFISTASGEIDLSASTVGGPYTISYTTNGVCPNTETFAVSIVDEDDPAFSYPANAYCQGDANPLPIPMTTGGTFSGPAGIVFVSTATGEIDLAASTSGGPYTITHTTNGVCPNSSTFDLTINPEDDANFSYLSNSYCQGDSDPTPAAIINGGTYSGPTGIVFVSTASGEIDLSASTVGGPYTISYTTNGVCPNTETFAVSIVDEDDPAFSYPSNTYCQGDANPLPIPMTAGGTFSGPAGIVFVSTSTGEIDLAASTSGGPYTITHATNGVCPNATTFDITINAEDDASFSYTEISYCQGDVSPVPTAVTSGGTYSGPMEIVFFTTTPGKVNLPASTVGGPYTITYQTSGVCPNSSTFDITILPTDDASFNYGPTSYCINDQNPTPTTSLPGGSFSAGIGLVFANTSTGEINLSASTPETYTVTYTTNGACPNFATQSITISALETVTFEYDATVFCVSDANQFPSVSPTGGTYEVSTGLSLVDAATGEISPNLSITEVPHTVQYTSSGACPNTVEIPITINAASIADAGVDIELPFLFSTELSAVAPTIGLGNWNTSSEYTIETTTDPQSPITDLNIGLNEAVWVVENGTCPAAMDTVIINVLDLWIPEAVTPNDDGKNDFFAFRSLDEATCHLQILNRWGQIVFEREDYQNDWQGNNMNGALQPADTYFYIAIINNEQTYKGYVVLKR